jgi:hypothetical protein
MKRHPLNAGIVNIDKAPKNAARRVEYTVDVRQTRAERLPAFSLLVAHTGRRVVIR